ncbi:MAG: ribosome biogenesis GTPase Der [Deltaproteobacteria bacterium]|nr:ribosome biogenesis GTPase Der [Deltaproteobacteria bacterium]MBU48290.1 ribosome biogenesis GTPase Der [Deltaproteobacteria bacterium]
MSERMFRVALIGRPNVGKSTLFNRLIGKKQAIVEDTPGVTRDRQYGHSDWNGLTFSMIDTGGLEPKTDDEILQAMRRQTEYAIEEADLIMMIVDGRQGLLPQDEEILRYLRRSEQPLVVGVNKIDNLSQEIMLADFYSLGVEDLFAISAVHGLGVGDMLDRVVEHLRAMKGDEEEVSEEKWEEEEFDEDAPRIPRVVVLGKPNAGKSTIINQILGEDRLLTMPIAGTTRDSIDVEVEFNGKPYKFIDTAGIRRKKYIKEQLEKVSVYQSIDSLGRSDVGLFMIDASVGITEQDVKIAGLIHNRGRGIIIVVNKWDLVKRSQQAMKEFEEEVRYKFKYLHYAPIVFCSALTGKRLHKVFEKIDEVYEAYRYRIPTGELNRFFTEMVEYHPPPVYRGRPIKFYYVTQVRVAPPSFMISANQPNAAHVTYKRFIINSLRANFGFEGVPIKLFFRQR